MWMCAKNRYSRSHVVRGMCCCAKHMRVYRFDMVYQSTWHACISQRSYENGWVLKCIPCVVACVACIFVWLAVWDLSHSVVDLGHVCGVGMLSLPHRFYTPQRLVCNFGNCVLWARLSDSKLTRSQNASTVNMLVKYYSLFIGVRGQIKKGMYNCSSVVSVGEAGGWKQASTSVNIVCNTLF